MRAGVHKRPLEIDGVETHAIDFDRPETLLPALEGVHTVFLVSYATLESRPSFLPRKTQGSSASLSSPPGGPPTRNSWSPDGIVRWSARSSEVAWNGHFLGPTSSCRTS